MAQLAKDPVADLGALVQEYKRITDGMAGGTMSRDDALYASTCAAARLAEHLHHFVAFSLPVLRPIYQAMISAQQVPQQPAQQVPPQIPQQPAQQAPQQAPQPPAEALSPAAMHAANVAQASRGAVPAGAPVADAAEAPVQPVASVLPLRVPAPVADAPAAPAPGAA